MNTVLSIYNGDLSKWYALLTPLSAITDEDAIEVQKIATTKKDVDMLFNTLSKEKALFECKYTAENNKHYEVIDFLRSRGYALPAYGHSVDELINEGIFKLKEKCEREHNYRAQRELHPQELYEIWKEESNSSQ